MRSLVNIMKLGAILLWTMSVALSCEHKTLCFDHSHMADLDIKFDWSGAPEAAITSAGNSLQRTEER